MNVFTTPSHKVSLNLERILVIRNYIDYIVVTFDSPIIDGLPHQQKYWYTDGVAILAAYKGNEEKEEE